MASYCEVCQIGFSRTPHTHVWLPVMASRGGPSPLRTDGGDDTGRAAAAARSSSARLPRRTSPYRSPLTRSRDISPLGRDGAGGGRHSPYDAHSQRYTRGTYSSERRRSTTSSPLRQSDQALALTYSTIPNGSSAGGARKRDSMTPNQARHATEAALAEALREMRGRSSAPTGSLNTENHEETRRRRSPDATPFDRADRYRYTHDHLPARLPTRPQQPSYEPESVPPLRGVPHPYDTTTGSSASPPTSSADITGDGASVLPPPLPSGFTTPHNKTRAAVNDDDNDNGGGGDRMDRLNTRQTRLKQTEWQQAMTARVEELRAGFVDLCAAVKTDMQALEARCLGGGGGSSGRPVSGLTAAQLPPRPAARSHSRDGLVDGSSPGSCDRPTRESSPLTTGTDEDGAHNNAFPPTLPALLSMVRAASDSDRTALAKVLWEDMRPLVQKEAQRSREKDQQRIQERFKASQTSLLAQMHAAHDAHVQDVSRHLATAAAAAAAAAAREASAAPRVTADLVRSLMPVDFSSPDALEAHLRAVARQVLAEEDAQRMGLASHNELRHTEAFNHQQQVWRTELKRAERDWRREYAEAMATERKTWALQDLNEVHRELNTMQQLVEAVTHDMADLTHRVTDAQERQTAWMAAESDRRSREQSKAEATLKERVESLVKASVAASSSSSPSPFSSSAAAAGGGVGITPSVGLSVPPTSSDAVRMELVQSALEHMKRLLAAHQKVVDATVERRCALAEQSVADRQHVWEQHVTELRAKVASLRTDVRSGFAELCQNLNMAAPGL